ncbi:type II toxin-antitoxin system VapC family toxin [Opitutus terrae]|uniref:PilT protein domain protein n=1 Tax=Opitutus terrae (strain DSM 11246 / JCM 15787 / PB90-1) TaxID=452637 RepID=B1ZPL4_OPITP|nr:type II toxin-antitoxin system VapC family toxin [Opitutus terrae]ACB74533.1 PilT protein domain protein [Opitutus terrae PB90-1]
MIAYPDTSFLCALYVAQSTSAVAIAHYRRMKEPLHVSVLLLGEFRQSVRFQIFRNSKDATQGYARNTGLEALAKLQSNIDAGALVVVPTEWTEVFHLAERISAQHTIAGGHRFMDVLHVATAMHLGAVELLSFDANQRKLAAAEGLAAKP